MATKYLDYAGLQRLVADIKSYVASHSGSKLYKHNIKFKINKGTSQSPNIITLVDLILLNTSNTLLNTKNQQTFDYIMNNYLRAKGTWYNSGDDEVLDSPSVILTDITNNSVQYLAFDVDYNEKYLYQQSDLVHQGYTYYIEDVVTEI